MRMTPSLPILLLIVTTTQPQQAPKGLASAPVRIGGPATLQGGIRLSAEEMRRLLQRGPMRADPESGELDEGGDRRHSQQPMVVNPVPVKRSAPMPDPISPLPSINWQVTTGTPPSAAVTGTPRTHRSRSAARM
jgi:hypothetical protein